MTKININEIKEIVEYEEKCSIKTCDGYIFDSYKDPQTHKAIVILSKARINKIFMFLYEEINSLEKRIEEINSLEKRIIELENELKKNTKIKELTTIP